MHLVPMRRIWLNTLRLKRPRCLRFGRRLISGNKYRSRLLVQKFSKYVSTNERLHHFVYIRTESA